MQQLRQKKIIKANKALVFFAIVSLYCLPVFSQSQRNTRHIYTYLNVDCIPKFQCGSNCLQRFIKQNLKWPDNAQDVEGIVLISFVVLANGILDDIKIEKPLSPEFDAEAMRMIKRMPRWEPGKVGKKVVDVKIYFPVDFYVINE